MKNILRKLLPLAVSFLLVFTAVMFIATPKATAAYAPEYLISDGLFTDYSSMSVNDIQNFLNNKNSGLKSLAFNEACSPPTPVAPYSGTYFPHCGVVVSAATVIYDAAQAYRISPKVILATLQKEQSLITTPNPTTDQLNCAMGYQSCSSSYTGFFQQIDNGAWQFRTYIELMNNRSWWGYAPSTYPCNNSNAGVPSHSSGGNVGAGAHYYNPGLYPGNDVTFYDYNGDAYTHFVLSNSATAGLYCYTPHVYPGSALNYFSGSYWFVYYYELWFGPSASPCYNDTNIGGAASGPKILNLKYAGVDRLAYTQQNNTGTTCAEAHLDNANFQNWVAHISTGMKAANPTQGTFVASKAFFDGQYSLNYIVYNGAGGRVEIHRISPDLKKFPGYYDVSTDLVGIGSTDGMFVAGDFFGRGYDQLLFVLYNGGGGKVELHMFDPYLRKAIGYTDIVTDLTGITAATGTFVAGDFFGRGYDQLAFILYNGAAGHVEIHVFDPTLRKAIGYYEPTADLVGITSSMGTFVAGDYLGRGYDQLLYVAYSGANGKVETHMFTPNLFKAIGYQDIITNISAFSPSD